jgi:hypothetical protein
MADRRQPPIGMPAMSSRIPITTSTAMITTTTRRTFPSGSSLTGFGGQTGLLRWTRIRAKSGPSLLKL